MVESGVWAMVGGSVGGGGGGRVTEWDNGDREDGMGPTQAPRGSNGVTEGGCVFCGIFKGPRRGYQGNSLSYEAGCASEERGGWGWGGGAGDGGTCER